MTTLFAATLLICTQAEPAAETPEAARVRVAVEAFREGASSDSPDDRVAAIDAVLPTEEDFETLFGENADALWAVVGPYNQALRDGAKSQAMPAAGEATVEVVDVREDPAAARLYDKALPLVGEDVGVYRAVVRGETSTSGLSAFVTAGERVVWIRGFESLPEVLQSSPPSSP